MSDDNISTGEYEEGCGDPPPPRTVVRFDMSPLEAELLAAAGAVALGLSAASSTGRQLTADENAVISATAALLANRHRFNVLRQSVHRLAKLTLAATTS